MRKLLVAVAVLALLGAACSKKTASGGSVSNGSGMPVTLSGSVNDHGTKDLSASGSPVSIPVGQHNYYFDPTFIKAAPGAKVTVQLKNDGTVPHSFTIDSLNIDQVVQPGESMNVTLTLPSSGAVAFYCHFHRSSGMQGAFYFQAGDAVPAGGASPASTSGSSSYGGGGY